MDLTKLYGNKKRTKTIKTKKVINTGYKRKKDKVQLLGTASSIADTKWDDKDSEIWACGPVITRPEAKPHIDDIDLIFEMHHEEYWKTIIERLNNTKKPVFMQEENTEIKKSMAYPLKEVQAMTKNEKLANYFTSSISYMIGLAILKGYEKIELFGIHMAAFEEEYSGQRACCDAWLAFADAKGIEFEIPDESHVMKCNYLYGYETQSDAVFTLIDRQRGLREGLKAIDTEKKKIEKLYNEQNGAIIEIGKLIKTI